MGKNINPEKLRDMVRSILPSVDRLGARRLTANENRRVRRDLRSDPEGADLQRDSNHRFTVIRRRGADKLNHYMRWCRALTKGMTREMALDYVRAIVPRNIIGDHAYGHWEAEVRPRSGR